MIDLTFPRSQGYLFEEALNYIRIHVATDNAMSCISADKVTKCMNLHFVTNGVCYRM